MCTREIWGVIDETESQAIEDIYSITAITISPTETASFLASN